MPNALRRQLKLVAKSCDDKLSGDPTFLDGLAQFDTGNLNRMKETAADMLQQIGMRKEATGLYNAYKSVSEWEDEIEPLKFLGEETVPALASWRRCVVELRDSALKLADSKKVIAAEGRAFSTIGETPIDEQTSLFVPTPLQTSILKALDGKALKKAELAEKVCGGDDRRLYKPGGITELRERGKVDHKHGVGFFRPDALPPNSL